MKREEMSRVKTSMRPERRVLSGAAGKGSRVPFYSTLDLSGVDAGLLFDRISGSRRSPGAFLLESGSKNSTEGRYSYLGLEPEAVYRIYGQRIEIERGGRTERKRVRSPLEYLQNMVTARNTVRPEGLPPFSGGLVGYLGYDMTDYFEPAPGPLCAEENSRPGALDRFPPAIFLLVDELLVYDNVSARLFLITNRILSGDLELEMREAHRRLREMEDGVSEALSALERPEGSDGGGGCALSEGGPVSDSHGGELDLGPDRVESVLPGYESNFGRREFTEAVSRAREHIHAGDIYQIVLSQRLTSDLPADPFRLYRVLGRVNPSPYMFYLDFGAEKIIGSSPELLVKSDGSLVTTRPLAGTRPRGADEAEDLRLEGELIEDEKERAEHIMLVDLGRNDLGRICRYGTVRVTELLGIERYSNVMHLVSSVEGEASPEYGPLDIIGSCFPAGTVSGAPRVRAMELIDRLEPDRRGPYAGAAGYVGYTGELDMCIMIRTMFVCEGRISVQAGAGIVADSVPEREFEETMHKAAGLLRTVAACRGGSARVSGY